VHIENMQLVVTIAETGAGDEWLDHLAHNLMQDLLDLGVESIERSHGESIPEGSKGGPFSLGALTLVAVPAFLPNLIEFLQAWTLRGEHRKIKIKTPAGLEVEFTSERRLSQEELLTLVEKLAKADAE
jgi:hypothetical protein